MILLITTRADIGGAQNHINLLFDELHNRYFFTLCSGQPGALVDRLASEGVNQVINPQITGKAFFPAVFSVYQLIKTDRPDLIHTHSAIASFIGRIAGRLGGVKTLYTVHGWHFVPNSVWKRRYFGWLLELVARPFTTAWITVSQYDLELGIKKGVIDRKRAWVVPNGVEDIEIEPRPLNRHGLSLVFVGRASFQKNCIEAIEILELCSDEVSLTMYVTSGDHLPELKQAVKDRGLDKRVTLITDNPNASDELHKFDAMLLTSRYEGMPLCVLEAMRASLPVVATDVCGMSEIVKHEKTGFLYPLNQIEQAADCIARLFDLETRQQFGDRARLLFLENHTAEKMAARTAEIYQKLLED